MFATWSFYLGIGTPALESQPMSPDSCKQAVALNTQMGLNKQREAQRASCQPCQKVDMKGAPTGHMANFKGAHLTQVNKT